MTDINKEIKMIYDFCEHHKNNLDKGADNTNDFNLKMMFTQQATCYWTVQQFIEANFHGRLEDE